MKTITIDEMFALSREQFIERHKAWIKEFEGRNNHIQITNPLKCPLHIWVVHNHAKCHQEVVGNTATCPICRHPCCPDCMNHNVEQLSRITGYMSSVSSWGAAKKQEFADRMRHKI